MNHCQDCQNVTVTETCPCVRRDSQVSHETIMHLHSDVILSSTWSFTVPPLTGLDWTPTDECLYRRHGDRCVINAELQAASWWANRLLLFLSLLSSCSSFLSLLLFCFVYFSYFLPILCFLLSCPFLSPCFLLSLLSSPHPTSCLTFPPSVPSFLLPPSPYILPSLISSSSVLFARLLFLLPHFFLSSPFSRFLLSSPLLSNRCLLASSALITDKN